MYNFIVFVCVGVDLLTLKSKRGRGLTRLSINIYVRPAATDDHQLHGDGFYRFRKRILYDLGLDYKPEILSRFLRAGLRKMAEKIDLGLTIKW